jgi:hypothetical protein
MCMDVYGCVWMCMDVDMRWLSMDVYGCVCMCMDVYGCVWMWVNESGRE